LLFASHIGHNVIRKKKIKHKIWSKTWYLKRNISFDAHFLNELLELLGYLFRQEDDFQCTKENCQNYGWSKHRTSCRQLKILPVPCRYTLSLMNFNNNKRENFQTRSSVHDINTRNKHHLHKTNTILSSLKKVHFMPESEFSTLCYLM